MPPNSVRDYSVELSPVESIRAAPLEAAVKLFDDVSRKVPCVSAQDIVVGELLGSGAFADVFEIHSIVPSSLEAIMNRETQAIRRDSPLESPNVSLRLVMKQLKPSSDSSLEKQQRDIRNEVQILSGLCHENIIRLAACSVDYDFLILERVAEDLDAWLERQRNLRDPPKPNKLHASSWSLRTVFASRQLVTSAEQEQQDRIRCIVRGLAQGIEYLHQNGVLHRDIKPANIGIDARGVVKLMDFGSARRIGAVNNNSTPVPLPHALVGSFVYLAPEVYQPGRTYSYSADVYSFAIVAWETCTLLTPYPELKYVSQIQRCVLESGMRPPLRAIASKQMRKLLQKCWHPDPDKAPTMEAVLETLEQIAPSCRADEPSPP